MSIFRKKLPRVVAGHKDCIVFATELFECVKEVREKIDLLMKYFDLKIVDDIPGHLTSVEVSMFTLAGSNFEKIQKIERCETCKQELK